MDTQDQDRQELGRRGVPSLATASHRLYIGAGGVTIYNTDTLDDPEEDPHDGRYPNSGLLLLSPREAVQVARRILAHESELEAQYEQVSQALLRLFRETWKQRQTEWMSQRPSYQGGYPDYQEFDRELHATYTRLVIDKSGPTRRWYEATFTDRFSHEQHEALFWRYFERKYRDGLIDDCFPDTNEAEADAE